MQNWRYLISLLLIFNVFRISCLKFLKFQSLSNLSLKLKDMEMKIFFYFLLVFEVWSEKSDNIKFSYKEKDVDGPLKWAEKYPSCARNSQSPINIEKSKVEKSHNNLKISYLKLEIESVKVLKKIN